MNLISDDKIYMEKQRAKNGQYTHEEEQVRGIVLPKIVFQTPTLIKAEINTQWSQYTDQETKERTQK